MKIRTDIENIASRYNVQVGTFDFSAAELQQIQNFGEPLIDVGGNFTGAVSRPGQSDTVLTVAGSHSVLATMTPVILSGSVTGVTVTAAGLGYTAATIGATGDGSGALLSPLFGVFGGTVVAPGSGYLLNDIVTFGSPNPVVVQITGVTGGGGVTSFIILNPGKLASVNQTVGLAMVGGTGNGFTTDFTGQWGVTAATVTAGGSGYNIVPTNVNFTLAPATRRLMTDTPVKEVFDLRDSADADIMAKVWANTIVSRMTTAKQTLMSLTSDFLGETVITV